MEVNIYTTSILSASTLIGNPVVNDGGEDLGKIEEIMIDTAHGNIAYAVLSFGGFLGFGDKYFAIPWETLKVDKMNHQFILNKTKEDWKMLPDLIRIIGRKKGILNFWLVFILTMAKRDIGMKSKLSKFPGKPPYKYYRYNLKMNN